MQTIYIYNADIDALKRISYLLGIKAELGLNETNLDMDTIVSVLKANFIPCKVSRMVYISYPLNP